MNPVEALLAGAGSWRGANTHRDSTTGRPEESPFTLAVTPVLGGRFLRVNSLWGDRGRAAGGTAAGRLRPEIRRNIRALGRHLAPGPQRLACKGTAGDGTTAVRASYPAPTGPDWGWRIEITAGAEGLRITHPNIDAEGAGDLAVQGVVSRA